MIEMRLENLTQAGKETKRHLVSLYADYDVQLSKGQQRWACSLRKSIGLEPTMQKNITLQGDSRPPDPPKSRPRPLKHIVFTNKKT